MGESEEKNMGRKAEQRRLEVDCGDFTFAVFFFLFWTKETKKAGRRGVKHKCLRVLAGFSASRQKQNGSVNKKRSLMLVSGARPQALQALEQHQHSSHRRGLLWDHVSRTETSQPEMYSHNKGRVQSVRLFIWWAH